MSEPNFSSEQYENATEANVDLNEIEKSFDSAIDSIVNGASGGQSISQSQFVQSFGGGSSSPARADSELYSKTAEAMGGMAMGGGRASGVIGAAMTVREETFMPGQAGGQSRGKKQKTDIFGGPALAERELVDNMGLPIQGYLNRSRFVKEMQKDPAKSNDPLRTGPGAQTNAMSLRERLGVTGMSVNDNGAGGGMKGAKISKEAAINLGVVPAQLLKGRDDVRRAKNGPLSAADIARDIMQGGDRGEQYARANPHTENVKHAAQQVAKVH